MLDHMVRDSMDSFKSLWQERASQRRSKSDWATTEVLSKPNNGRNERKEVDEEVLTPGSIIKVAIGERVQSIPHVYVTISGNMRVPPGSGSAWQQKLCKVLVDVCSPDMSTKINPSAIKETPNHLSYLQLEVHGNHTFVGNALEWREIGFAVEIIGPQNELVKKYFAINLQVHAKRLRRSVRSGSIPREGYDFPDYEQHSCCGGCKSGCSPVAWAQVFGYYDRLGYSLDSKYSGSIYRDRLTKAPLRLTDEVERLVEDIRSQVHTTCVNGEGGTERRKMYLIAPWFRSRQGSRSRVVSYLPSRKKRLAVANGGRIERGGHSWIAAKGVYWLKKDYPVIFSIDMEGRGGHAVVATKYKEKTRRYRHCYQTKTGFLWGERTKEICSWRTAYDYEFYLHYGWGGSGNKWQQIGAKGAYVAYLA